MIVYRDSTVGLRPEQFEGFFVGWSNPPSPETHLRLLRNCQYVEVALDEETDQVVGFISAISDGVLCVFISLLEVLPEYQGEGVGSELTQRMIDRVSDYYMVDLNCDMSLQAFYAKFGMKPATGTMLRNYAAQSGRPD